MKRHVLGLLLDRPIAYHRCLADLSGSINAGLMLSQAFYWSNRTDDPEGWFWKTRAEWFAETGLNRPEQETARKKLRKITAPDGTPIWEEIERGLPCKLYFRINQDALYRALVALNDQENNQENDQEPDPPPSRIQNEKNRPVGLNLANRQAGFQPTFYIAESTSKTTVYSAGAEETPHVDEDDKVKEETPNNSTEERSETKPTTFEEKAVQQPVPAPQAPSAVAIYHQAFPSIKLPTAREQQLAKAVADLNLWRETVAYWEKNQMPPQDLPQMINTYRALVKTTKKPRAKKTYALPTRTLLYNPAKFTIPGGYCPKGEGNTVYEIYREYFNLNLYPTVIEDLDRDIKDLDEWRDTVAYWATSTLPSNAIPAMRRLYFSRIGQTAPPLTMTGGFNAADNNQTDNESTPEELAARKAFLAHRDAERAAQGLPPLRIV